MALRPSPRYRLVVAPLLLALATTAVAWSLIGVNLITAGLAGAGAGAGLWAYFRHGAGASEPRR